MAYDEVIDDVACPVCGAHFEIAAQIKYGNCSGRRLKAGDEINWCDPRGRAAPLSDQNRNWGGHVLVPGGAQDSCPHCQAPLPDTAVDLRDNVVLGVVFANVGHDAVQLSPATHWFDYSSRRVAGAANEDRLQVFCSGNRWTIALADGAGGTSGGARAASQAVDAAASFGRTSYNKRRVVRFPKLGSGTAAPVPINRCPLAGRLVVATDGLFNYLSREKLVELALLSPVETAVAALIRAARLPSGALQDDIAIVLGEWADVERRRSLS
ncbi:MAG: hypothetical protein QM756_00585 [Polyangiaceae bacterium]